jgi:pimeloyl-ACP methyl ester carboxylesterase
MDLACPCVNLAQLARCMNFEQLDSLTRGIVGVEMHEAGLTLRFDSGAARAAFTRIREAIEAWVGAELIAPLDSPPLHYGITFVTPDDERAPLAALREVPARAVILVHGLDDPGWMWREVIPPLIEAGHVVARLDYPNDGPIAASADLLARELERLKAAGVERVDLVGKSMGGLVIRDVLTRAEHYAGDGSGNERLPAVDRFIMIGTPNHGSSMAHLRGVLEFGEHLSRAWIGNGHGSSGRWPDHEADGCGEAGIDLLPGSPFLAELNARPLATHTRHTIIAGRLVPIEEQQLSEFSQRWTQRATGPDAAPWLRDLAFEADLNRAAGAVGRAIDLVGDGLVSLESTGLEGVNDVVIVSADHIGLMCNLTRSGEPPPAVPILLDRLSSTEAIHPAAER